MVNIAEKKKITKKSKAEPKAKKEALDVSKHFLVPKHTKLSEAEKNKVLEHYKVTLDEFPRIHISDPAIADLELSTNDLIKVDRPSATSKISLFYRRVVK